MNKNDQILDDLFRSKLDNLEESPSLEVWERIKEKQIRAKKYGYSRMLRLTGVAAAVLLAFFIGWNLLEESQKDDLVASDDIKNLETLKTTENSIVVPKDSIGSLNSQPLVPQTPVVIAELPVRVSRKQQTSSEESSPENVSKEKNIFSGLLERRNPDLSSVNSEIPKLLDFKPKPGYKALTAADRELIAMNMISMENGKGSPNEWGVGAYFNPAYSINQSSNNLDYSRSYITSNRANMNMGGGLLVDYHIDKRWSVQSGLMVNNLSQATISQNEYPTNGELLSSQIVLLSSGWTENNPVTIETYSNIEINNSFFLNAPAGVVQLAEASSIQDGFRTELYSTAGIEQNFTYLEVPLYFKYQLIDKTFGFDVSGGVSANILVGNRVFMDNSNIGKTQDMKEFNYSTGVGVGVSYKFWDNLSAQVQPVFKYYPNSLNRNPEVDFRPYSFGIQAGVRYRFNK